MFAVAPSAATNPTVYTLSQCKPSGFVYVVTFFKNAPQRADFHFFHDFFQNLIFFQTRLDLLPLMYLRFDTSVPVS